MVDLFVTEGSGTGTVSGASGDFSDPLPPDIDAKISAIRTLVAAARTHRLPIFYTNDRFEPDGRDLGAWRHKSWAAPGLARQLAGKPCLWIDALAPDPEDWVIYKQRPSPFFGTSLVSNLVDLAVDTVAVGGQTTSGCVRAAVVDAFSYGFRTIVAEECTYDRCIPSHKINLFDMHQKYADVVPLAEVLSNIATLSR